MTKALAPSPLSAMKASRGTVYAVVRTVLGACPICGQAWPQDRRYRRRAAAMTLRVYRLSPRSVTMECRACGLRFGATFQRLARAMDVKATAEDAPERAERWRAWAEYVRAVSAPPRPGRRPALTRDT